MGHSEQGMAAKLQSILARIPDQTLVPAYNTDDLYIFDDETFEIVQVVGSSTPAYRSMRSQRMPSGYSACMGREAASLGLWHATTDGRLIDPERAAQARIAFNKAREAA